jgi:hypothetical protein
VSTLFRKGYTKRLLRTEPRKAAKPDKGPPRWQRELSKGSARTTFLVGMLLTLPGASYLAGLDDIHTAALFDDGDRAAGDRLQPGHALAARGSARQLRDRSGLDTSGDRASQGLGQPTRTMYSPYEDSRCSAHC